MNADMPYMSLVTALASEDQLVLHKGLIKKLGLYEAAIISVFCSKYKEVSAENKLTYFDDEPNKEYFYCTRENIEKETGLKSSVQRAATSHLAEVEVPSIRKEGMPATNYYSLDPEKIAGILNDWWCENGTTSGAKMEPPVVRNSHLSITSNTITSKLANSNLANKQNTRKKNIQEKKIYNGKNCSDAKNEPLTNENVLGENSTENRLELIREKITSKKGATADQAVETVISHLNELAGTHYRPTKADTIKVITARLKEGYSVDDLRLVVSYKCDEWMGTDMQKYLRPETLFRPSKFEGYLNAAMSGAPARKRASNADTSSGKKVSTAFRDLSETERKKNLSGLKF